MSSSVAGQAAVLEANAKTFDAVVKAAKGGDTIRLVGTFGLTRIRERTFTTPLKIDATRARFTDALVLSNVKGVSISGGSYGSTTGKVSYNQAIAIYRSSDIVIDRAKVVGSTVGTGIGVSTGRNVTVTNSTFDKLKAGVMFTSVTGGRVQGNISRDSSSDGFVLADNHNILVKGNSCSGGQIGPGYHPDCIQLWSIKGNPVQSDITITENKVTGYTQGITSFNPLNGGGLRLTITNNRVDTTMPQGIACYACVDSVITGNVITSASGATRKTRLNVIGGGNNIVENNYIGEFVRPSDAGKNVVNVATSDFTTFESTLTSNSGSMTSGRSAGIVDMAIVGDAVVSAVPEPSSWLLLIAGFGLTGAMMRRRTRNAQTA